MKLKEAGLEAAAGGSAGFGEREALPSLGPGREGRVRGGNQRVELLVPTQLLFG